MRDLKDKIMIHFSTFRWCNRFSRSIQQLADVIKATGRALNNSHTNTERSLFFCYALWSRPFYTAKMIFGRAAAFLSRPEKPVQILRQFEILFIQFRNSFQYFFHSVRAPYMRFWKSFAQSKTPRAWNPVLKVFLIQVRVKENQKHFQIIHPIFKEKGIYVFYRFLYICIGKPMIWVFSLLRISVLILLE